MIMGCVPLCKKSKIGCLQKQKGIRSVCEGVFRHCFSYLIFVLDVTARDL